MNIRFMLSLQNFRFEDSIEKHINKMPFSGICAFVDTPSDGSPVGANGKPVVFTKEAVENALPTIVGMGVNCVWTEDYWANPANALTGHDERFKIGVVEAGELDGNAVKINGFLWSYDFYDVCAMIKNAKDSLGFSVEIVVKDIEEDDNIIYVKDFIFTGVAILYSDLAAFKSTRLVAQRGDYMDKEQIMELMEKTKEEAVAQLREEFENKIAEFKREIEEISNQLNEAKEQLKKYEAMEQEKAELQTKIEAMNAQIAEIQEKKADKIVRKSIQFATIAKYGEDKDLHVLCEEISQDKELSPTEKWKLKLEAWRKNRS